MHHGIDLKEPIHNVKEARLLRAKTDRHSDRNSDLHQSGIVSAKRVVEPIGIEPMT